MVKAGIEPMPCGEMGQAERETARQSRMLVSDDGLAALRVKAAVRSHRCNITPVFRDLSHATR